MDASSERLPSHLVGQDPVLDYLCAHRLFGALPRPVLVGLAATVKEREYLRGQYIFHAGDPPDYLYLVKSGLVLLTQDDQHGKMYALCVCSPGDSFGLAPVVMGHKRILNAFALVHTTAFLLNKETVDYVYRTSPELVHQITRGLYSEMLRFVETAIRGAQTPAASRVARFLLEYGTKAASPGGDQPIFDLDLSHNDIALLLQTTRETVNRVLADLSRRGVISVNGRKMQIIRADALQDLVWR